MIDAMQVVVHRIVRLRDGRLMGFAQYGSLDGFPIVNAHGGLACRLDVAAALLANVPFARFSCTKLRSSESTVRCRL